MQSISAFGFLLSPKTAKICRQEFSDICSLLEKMTKPYMHRYGTDGNINPWMVCREGENLLRVAVNDRHIRVAGVTQQ